MWILPRERGLVPSYTEWTPTPRQERDQKVLVISPDGLVLTIGYLILEAEQVELVTEDAARIPARRTCSSVRVTVASLGEWPERSSMSEAKRLDWYALTTTKTSVAPRDLISSTMGP